MHWTKPLYYKNNREIVMWVQLINSEWYLLPTIKYHSSYCTQYALQFLWLNCTITLATFKTYTSEELSKIINDKNG